MPPHLIPIDRPRAGGCELEAQRLAYSYEPLRVGASLNNLLLGTWCPYDPRRNFLLSLLRHRYGVRRVEIEIPPISPSCRGRAWAAALPGLARMAQTRLLFPWPTSLAGCLVKRRGRQRDYRAPRGRLRFVLTVLLHRSPMRLCAEMGRGDIMGCSKGGSPRRGGLAAVEGGRSICSSDRCFEQIRGVGAVGPCLRDAGTSRLFYARRAVTLWASVMYDDCTILPGAGTYMTSLCDAC